MPTEFNSRTRLETWKEVATFFNKDESTVKRWEARRGLPIHRLPGDHRSRIFAVVAELEAWRDGGGAEEGEPADATPLPANPANRLPLRAGALFGLFGVGLIGLAAAGFGLSGMVRPASAPPTLAAQRDYVSASDDWARRTPQSLTRAIGEYDAAIARDPDYAEAWAGLASTYDLLREYTRMPPSQAYPLAKAAAQRALRLDDRVADAHTALAFAEYWGFWNAAAARREFDRSIALDPHSATAQHWYATFLSATGDQGGALRRIEAALSLDPGSEAVAADRGLILTLAGRDAEGLAVLRSLERARPDSKSVHAYLAEYDLDHGDFVDYLAEARRVAQLTGDRGAVAAADVAGRGLASGGRNGFLTALVEGRLDGFRNGQVPAYSVAEAYALAGDGDRALAFLAVSLDRRETNLMAARSNRLFIPIRSRPEFGRILARATPLDTD